MKIALDLMKEKKDALAKLRASLLHDVAKTEGAIEVVDKIIQELEGEEEDG